MRRTPPNGNEDDQLEDSQTTNRPQRRRNPATRDSRNQNARDAQEMLDTAIDYYSDDQPNSPIKRRASLNLDNAAPVEPTTEKTFPTSTTKHSTVRPSTTSMRTARPERPERLERTAQSGKTPRRSEPIGSPLTSEQAEYRKR